MTSELSRSQQRNLSDCVQKISAIIAEASEKPHEPTAEDVAVREARYYLVVVQADSVYMDSIASIRSIILIRDYSSL